ncbi:MAG: DinB family protein, partial [Rhodanobacter sp.]
MNTDLRHRWSGLPLTYPVANTMPASVIQMNLNRRTKLTSAYTSVSRDDLQGSRELLEMYNSVRTKTDSLIEPLSVEDMVVQSMPDASPTKWHLAHTTWFWETFLLQANKPDYKVFNPAFGYLFNSYYNAAGPRHPRLQRGAVTRPT